MVQITVRMFLSAILYGICMYILSVYEYSLREYEGYVHATLAIGIPFLFSATAPRVYERLIIFPVSIALNFLLALLFVCGFCGGCL